MKKIHIIITALFFTISASSQDKEQPNFFIGLQTSIENSWSENLKGNTTLFYGVNSEFKTKSNLIIHLSVNHSIRNYNVEKDGLITYVEERYGGTASYRSEIKEQVFEIENILRYEFLANKKITPSFGLGYSILIPYSIEGKRIVIHAENFGGAESLGFPGKLSSYTKLGLISTLGTSFLLTNKIKLKTAIEYKWFPDSAFNIYGYPTRKKSIDHNSVNFTLGILYALK